MKRVPFVAGLVVLSAAAAAAWAYGIGGLFDSVIANLEADKVDLATADQNRISNAVKALQGPSDDVVVLSSTKNLKLAVLRLGKLATSDADVAAHVDTAIDAIYPLVSGRSVVALQTTGAWALAHPLTIGNAAKLGRANITIGKTLAALDKAQNDADLSPAKRMAAFLKANTTFEKIIRQFTPKS
jgi:hypothetical protein